MMVHGWFNFVAIIIFLYTYVCVHIIVYVSLFAMYFRMKENFLHFTFSFRLYAAYLEA